MTERASILVVEDEERIRIGLRDFLEFHDYAVTEAADGGQALRLVGETRFDLVLLDLMLPEVSGEQLCRSWREQGLEMPIIMLTAKGQEKEKVSGLNLGADDYITKPFSLEELMARVEAVLRRVDPSRSVGRMFEFGPWQVDMAALKISRNSKECAISRREAEIIQFFAANVGRVIPREELYEKVWHETMTELGTRTVDVHIGKLRSKIESNSPEPEIIKTVRGVGYRYEG